MTQHHVVGTGADFWARKPNRYAGCSCPPQRYNPCSKKVSDPSCTLHGKPVSSEQQETHHTVKETA